MIAAAARLRETACGREALCRAAGRASLAGRPVSAAELRQIVAGTGWHVARLLPSPGSTYIAVLEKGPAST